MPAVYKLAHQGPTPPRLELEGWDGEDESFEFALSSSPGQSIYGVGLVYGPSRVEPQARRVQVTVGTGYTIDFSAPIASWLLAQQLAESDEDRDRPIGEAHAVESAGTIELAVDGTPTPFALAAYGESWWAQGRWEGWYVEVGATRVSASDVRLRRGGVSP